MNLIGANLKRLRKERNLSQQALSNRLELLGVYVCRGSVSRIEDMTRTVTDIELFAIAEVLGVGIESLFEIRPDKKLGGRQLPSYFPYQPAAKRQ